MQSQTLKIGDRIYIQDDDSNTGIIVGFLPNQYCVAVIVKRDNTNSSSYWHPSCLTLID